MLTVGKVGPANAGYYQSAVVAGMEDYYAGEGEAPAGSFPNGFERWTEDEEAVEYRLGIA